MPKITKARGATSADDGSHFLPPDGQAEQQERQPEEPTADAPVLERPAKSATRGDWNAYAESVGVEDAADLANKAAVIAAVDELE